jgi:hypothetical protein
VFCPFVCVQIWKIFGGTKLQVQKMKDWELLAAVGAFIGVDVIINAVWMATAGMKAVEMVVDPDRPYYNYYTCDYAGAEGPIYLHLAIKGGILLLGVALTWAVRNTPSQFNESTLIGLSIYNVSFVIAFIVPIIAVGLGGRRTVYLIRAYAIMFVVLTTLGLLYIPKLLNLAEANMVTHTNTHTHIGGGGGGGMRRVRVDHTETGAVETRAPPSGMSGRTPEQRTPLAQPAPSPPLHARPSPLTGGSGAPMEHTIGTIASVQVDDEVYSIAPPESGNPISNFDPSMVTDLASEGGQSIPIDRSHRSKYAFEALPEEPVYTEDL